MKKLTLFAVSLFIFSTLSIAHAGVKLKVAEDTNINLGFRTQALFVATETPVDDDLVSKEDFLVRRARLRLGGDVTKWASFFLQTEKGSGDGGSGYDMRLIDAWASLNFHDLVRIYIGEHMAPAGRQITTSSGGLMAIDRPNITNYNLTWGLNGRYAFNTETFPNGNLPLSNATAVRDEGVTLFGSSSFNENVHFKYYLGIYDGIQTESTDEERLTARVQFNFLDSEPGYFNMSTYLGKKKTIGIGASYDRQNSIAQDAVQGNIDYAWWEVDTFLDLPLGPGFITVEGAYQDLDLDDATQMGALNARETQGNGWFVQTGYLIEDLKLQPWVSYQSWDSDAADDRGDFNVYQVGLTYFIKGHNANIKVGYERFEAEQDIAPTGKDTIDSFVTGLYITY